MVPWSENLRTQKEVIKLTIIFFIGTIITGMYLSSTCPHCSAKQILQCIVYFKDVLMSFNFKGVDERAMCVGLFSILECGAFCIWLTVLLLCPKDEEYGEARFANKNDLKKMRLLPTEETTGLIVGKLRNTLLSPSALRHGLVLAPTRSGKTAGFVIPTALSFKGSMVITDPKGELEAMLAEPLKQKGYTVYSVDWSNEYSKDSWNPLSMKVFPSVHDQYSKAERQAERIAAMLVATDKEDHWSTNAKKHIAALILLAVYEAEELALGNITSMQEYEELKEPHLDTVYHYIARGVDKDALARGEEGAITSAKSNLLEVIKRANNKKAPDRIIYDLSTWYNAPDSEAGSHMTTFLSKLQIWRSRAVKGATRCCSFEWQELREEKSVVFIKFPQQDAQSLGVLTALFFETFFGWALDVPRKKNEAPIAILADEFGSLPKINLMTDFLSKGAGIGSVIWIIVQDFSQIKQTYGDKSFETIKTNCSYLLTYAQNNFNTQKELTQMTGKMTRRKSSKSKNDAGKVSVSYNYEGVDLMPVSDWGSIPFGHHVLLVQGYMTNPIYCETPLYFKQKAFVKMLNGEKK